MSVMLSLIDVWRRPSAQDIVADSFTDMLEEDLVFDPMSRARLNVNRDDHPRTETRPGVPGATSDEL